MSEAAQSAALSTAIASATRPTIFAALGAATSRTDIKLRMPRRQEELDGLIPDGPDAEAYRLVLQLPFIFAAYGFNVAARLLDHWLWGDRGGPVLLPVSTRQSVAPRYEEEQGEGPTKITVLGPVSV